MPHARSSRPQRELNGNAGLPGTREEEYQISLNNTQITTGVMDGADGRAGMHNT